MTRPLAPLPRPLRTALALTAALLTTGIARGQTLYVAPCGNDAWAGVNVGCAPPLGPKRTIQAAVAQAVPGTEIIVLPGVYPGAVDLLGKAVTVRGAGGAPATIIDAGGARHAVSFTHSEGPGTVIEGFTIRGGDASGAGGGGIFITGAAPTIRACIVENNHADEDGGGLYALAGSPVIDQTTFRNNTSDADGGGAAFDGGSPVLTGCVFESNEASRGGGLDGWSGTFTLQTCRFTDNFAYVGGGAAIDDSTASLTLCIFENNEATIRGGGLFVYESTVTATLCGFHGNGGEVDLGGGIATGNATVTIAGCSFTLNTALLDGAGMSNEISAVAIRDTVFDANRPTPGTEDSHLLRGAGLFNDRTTGIVERCTFRNGLAARGAGLAQRGEGPVIAECAFESNIAQHFGGGACVFNEGALVIRDTTFEDNVAGTFVGAGTGGGGAIFVDEGTAAIDESIFTGNSGGYGGGAIEVASFAAVSIEDSTFIGNAATTLGGAIALPPGAGARCEVVRSTFEANQTMSAAGGGGGAIGHAGASLLVSASTFVGNHTPEDGGAILSAGPTTVISSRLFVNAAQSGGAIYVDGDPAVVIANSILRHNDANAGGAIFDAEGDGTRIANCTVVKNTAGIGGALLTGGTPRILNSIVWDNGPSAISGTGSPDIAYSTVAGGWPGAGNLDSDPLFVNPGVADFRLSAASPCVDAGANHAVPADASDLDADGNEAERLPLDLDGASRFADAAAENTGCGTDAVVDMGAYERAGVAEPDDVLLGDVTGDGAVDFDDLIQVLSAWGVCPGCCPADINADGNVDFADLLSVLAQWS